MAGVMDHDSLLNTTLEMEGERVVRAGGDAMSSSTAMTTSFLQELLYSTTRMNTSSSSTVTPDIPSSLYPTPEQSRSQTDLSHHMGLGPELASLGIDTVHQPSNTATEDSGIGVMRNPDSLRFDYSLDDDNLQTKPKSKKAPPIVYREQDRFVPINNTGRVMRNSVPKNAKISKDAKQCMQECISEFISFLTSEASDRCIDEKRKTITGDDILYALSNLGFDNYVEPLQLYLKKYREFIHGKEGETDDHDDNQLPPTQVNNALPTTTPTQTVTSMEAANVQALQLLASQLATPTTSLPPRL